MAVDRVFTNVAIRQDTLPSSAANSSNDPQPLTTDANGAVWVHQGDLQSSKDSVAVNYDMSAIMNSTTALTPTFFTSSATNSSGTVLISSQAGKAIRIVEMLVTGGAGGQSNYILATKAGASAEVAIWPTIFNTANTTTPFPFNAAGWAQTNSGESLSVKVGAVGVGFTGVYVAI